MGNLISTALYTLKVFRGISQRILFGYSPQAWLGDTESDSEGVPPPTLPSFLNDATLVSKLKLVDGPFHPGNLQQLSDEQIIKICRQLEFWYSETGGGLKNQSAAGDKAMIQLATALVDKSCWYDRDGGRSNNNKFQVPKVRFGKTELQMPVITCGGMRFQAAWLPDSLPIISPSRKTVLASYTQTNIKNCIRKCMELGINHFETARLYGTSEYQMVDALYDLMQEGVIKREDFILQTKIFPGKADKFKKLFQASWDNIGEKLGYIDLLSLHAISEWSDDVKESFAILEELKDEGKIRHIGFSTHATSEQTMKLINTEKFEYINLHYHYFGSYRSSGTVDSVGGQGNLACVKRALELDMGVFQISPFDKGGKLYRPSKECALTLGTETTPIEFASLYAWKKVGIHTSSVGFGRPSDLDEVMNAARIVTLGKENPLLEDSLERMKVHFEEKVGKDWAEKGLLNLPNCFDESSHGIALGQILFLHDLLVGFGMYEFCKDRYIGLETTSWTTKWDNKKSFEENVKKVGVAGDTGRSFDESVDLSDALKNHYNPELAMQKLRDAHKWLSSEQTPESGYSDKDLAGMGFQKGYNLTAWTEIPGELDSTMIGKLLITVFTGGRMGFVTGPGSSFRKEARQLRDALS